MVGWAAAALALAVPATAHAAGEAHLLGGRPDFVVEELPAGPLRDRVSQLPGPARERAMGWMRGFEFPAADAASLRIDDEGGVYYEDAFPLPAEPPAGAASTEGPAAAAVPVSPFPDAMKFHSRPGAPNVIFLDFDGASVSGTAWNGSVGRDPIPAVAFSTDADFTTFSDAEQLAVKRIWQRVAEDFAPFDVDVTTEAPSSMGLRIAHALITRNTDADGQPNPSSSAGGVAYVNVFNSSSYAYYRPAWIYYNNLSSSEAHTAEAASHETGHNLGLSHDGKTDGTEYYGGHGSGDTSWGPIMGTGYGRSVSQWSKGEYYLANNTQDDLAIVAGKTGYRADDRGNTLAAAAPMTISGGTNIVATTPESDPANADGANKGVLERAGDADVFSFSTGNGAVHFDIKPWVSPANTRGGNLDILARVYDSAGTLRFETNPTARTSALVDTLLESGVYYLSLTAAGTGDPLANPPLGYTAYGSLGQYFISGWVTDASGVVVPPRAALEAGGIGQPGVTGHAFRVTYTDNLAIDVSSLDGSDIRVTGPGSYDRLARLTAVNSATNGTPRVATYAVDPGSGPEWMPADNGVYSVWVETDQVADVEGAFVAVQRLGSFTCSVPAVIYAADMSTDPGWTLSEGWAFGRPTGQNGDPTGGATGTNVVGYNLGGAYARSSAVVYATTAPFNCIGADSVVLQFKRWLGVRRNDTAAVEVSVDGTNWSTVWRAQGNIVDSSWQTVQYDISGFATGRPAVRIRWSMGGNGDKQTSFGWNIDDVQVFGTGAALDTMPPGASLNAAPLTFDGQPLYEFTVTYTDNVAVALASLGDADLQVSGPAGYTSSTAFAGADVSEDASPLTATYRLEGPGGAWDRSENGVYEVVLLDSEVTDSAGNAAGEQILGSFVVNIPEPRPQRVLTVAVTPADWGSVAPAGGAYADGSQALLTATANQYYRFVEWQGDLAGSDNPAALDMTADRTVTAVFDNVYTTNGAVPCAWLGKMGYTGDLELAAASIGSNGVPVWASYVAGLDPCNPTSRFEIVFIPQGEAADVGVMSWNSASGRLYTVMSGPGPGDVLAPVPGAIDLPWTQAAHTARLDAASGCLGVSVRIE